MKRHLDWERGEDKSDWISNSPVSVTRNILLWTPRKNGSPSFLNHRHTHLLAHPILPAFCSPRLSLPYWQDVVLNTVTQVIISAFWSIWIFRTITLLINDCYQQPLGFFTKAIVPPGQTACAYAMKLRGGTSPSSPDVVVGWKGGELWRPLQGTPDVKNKWRELKGTLCEVSVAQLSWGDQGPAEYNIELKNKPTNPRDLTSSETIYLRAIYSQH